MKRSEYIDSMKDWFAWTMLEAFETVPKALTNPRQAKREMKRLKYQSDAQLQEAFRLAERQVMH